MSDLEKEKAIINESPDFETQREILNEEKEVQKKLRRFYMHVGTVFFIAFMLIVVAYVTIDIYKEYNYFSNNVCLNVNVNAEGTDFKYVNITEKDDCIPVYNIDYFNNRRATFNIDVYGDKSFIFNPTNQLDENGVCKLNCDSNNDHWPDYNIDLDGDGKADLNIVFDYENSTACDLNCDLNHDTIPDTNIDIDGDGKPDINITDDDDRTVPKYNVDYKGDRKPEFNVLEDDGTVSNPVNPVVPGQTCSQNCDIDGDGWPDYNVKLPGRDDLLNELVKEGDESRDYDKGKPVDWKCFLGYNLPSCHTNNTTKDNEYHNLDIDGDGTPDVNVPDENGNLENPVNKKGTVDGKDVTLNEDVDGDGFPDYNIDIDNDGKPDLNVTDPGSHECKKNCDTNYDGKPDYRVETDTPGGNPNHNLNVDTDFDNKCDLNCDTNHDLKPDLNIDTDGDGIPDVNIDTDGDGNPDTNVDTDGDGKPDKNLDGNLDGVCDFNCENDPNTNVDYSDSCTVNCDTDGDNWPDKDVDIDHDGTCDVNCSDGSKEDKDHNYIPDENEGDINIDTNEEDTFYVLNPMSINDTDIEPGWHDTYTLTIKNNTDYAISYKIEWTDVSNDFTNENNLYYRIARNGSTYLDNLRAPYSPLVIADNLIIRPKTTLKYVIDMRFLETYENQNIDSGKTFKGKLVITTNK